MADSFKGVVEKFRVSLVHSDGHTERVVVQIGLDGLKIVNASDNRPMRSYELSHIARWQSRGNQLILYTKTPSDVEERQTTLEGDSTTVRNALDTLTCCCMQLCELLQSKKSETAQETANNLHALVAGGGKKKTPLPSADEVEYWKSPDKAGWLMSQGEIVKSWRKRWFVLKQGYLFRFYDQTVSEAIKPRGVVDLSKVQDVKVVPGKSNTIILKTSSGGSVSYNATSETEVVEWVSALEGAIAKIVKHLAGVEEEPAPAASTKASAAGGGGGSSSNAELLQQLERNLSSLTTNPTAASSSSSASRDRGERDRDRDRHRERERERDRSHSNGANVGSQLINIVGYEASAGGGGGSSSSHHYDRSNSSASAGGGYGRGDSYSYANTASASASSGPYGAASGSLYGAPAGNGYGAGIAGANVVSNDTAFNYGSDPYLQRSTSASMPPPQQPQPSYSAPSNGGAYGAYAGGSYSAGQPAPQQQQQHGGYGAPLASGGMSLIDQPQQAPSYPYFQPAMAPPTSVPTWQVHYTAEGRPYYYNANNGITQWEPPAGFAGA